MNNFEQDDDDDDAEEEEEEEEDFIYDPAEGKRICDEAMSNIDSTSPPGNVINQSYDSRSNLSTTSIRAAIYQQRQRW